MAESVILEKSKSFALRIIKLYKYLTEEKKSLYYQSNSYAVAQALGPTQKKALSPSQKLIYALDFLWLKKNAPKQSIG